MSMRHTSVVLASPDPPSIKDAVSWSVPPDLESEIAALAAFCQVKQQQRQPLVSLGGETDTDEDDPRFIDQDKEVKQEFLDRLAELLRYDPRPTFITSTALVSSETEVTIVAARNSTSAKETWLPKDFEMLESLAAVLEKVAADGMCFCRYCR